MRRRLTAKDVIGMKGRERIVMVTAYDYQTARLVDRAGVDIILVGDSAAMVMMGYEDTRYITMEEMIVFCKSASRGVEHAMVVGDMPFMSYQASEEEAVRNAGRLVKEGLVDAVKLEGGQEYVDVIRSIVRAGIPVMGHVGLTPQSASMQTGYSQRGKRAEEAERIIEDARAVEKAGAFSLVLEFTSSEVAEIITEELRIPVIGIGSGSKCDGQVLVIHDLIGMFENPPPFVKQYARVGALVEEAVRRYVEDVRSGKFPDEEHTFHMKEEEYQKLLQRLKKL